MIARLLKLFLLLQVLGALAIASLLSMYWQVGAPAALLLGIVAMLLARACLTAQNFSLSWRYGSPTPAPHQPRPWQRCRLFVTELGANLLCTSWCMSWPRVGWQIAAQPAEPGKLPVLMLHGYAGNGGFWSRLSGLLRRAGISHYAPDLEPPLADIDDLLPQVELAITELCRRSGARQVVIVAHSMGGLVARAYLRRHGPDRVARVITLGTPHHGTGLASFGTGRNAAQMRRAAGPAGPGPGEWLSALAATESAHQRALFTSMFSHHDNIIAPQTSAVLPGAKNLAFSAIGHVSMGCDPRVLRSVLDEIALASAAAGAGTAG